MKQIGNGKHKIGKYVSAGNIGALGPDFQLSNKGFATQQAKEQAFKKVCQKLEDRSKGSPPICVASTGISADAVSALI